MQGWPACWAGHPHRNRSGPAHRGLASLAGGRAARPDGGGARFGLSAGAQLPPGSARRAGASRWQRGAIRPAPQNVPKLAAPTERTNGAGPSFHVDLGVAELNEMGSGPGPPPPPNTGQIENEAPPGTETAAPAVSAKPGGSVAPADRVTKPLTTPPPASARARGRRSPTPPGRRPDREPPDGRARAGRSRRSPSGSRWRST